jgi:RND superfamily putative drug exporter
MFSRLARTVQRRAGVVVALWAVGAAFITVAAPSVRELGTADQTAFVPATAPSGRADALLRRAFPDDPSRDPAVLVLVRSEGLQQGDRAYVARLARYLASPSAAGYVNAVQTAATAPELAPILRSPDGRAELVIVSLKAQVFTAAADEAIAFLREHMAGTAPPGLTHEVTGLAALASDQATATLEAFDRTLVATIVLVLLILVLVYRSALAPLISLVSIGCAFLVARGVAGYLAEAGVKIASLAETFMVVMAFGAGTDYVMFVISRYREFSGDPAGRRRGLQRASTMVAPTIVASGATVTIAFLAFLTADLGLFRSFGPVLGLAVAVTVVAGLTLTPALLHLAGGAAFWPSRRHGSEAAAAGQARWERIAGFVSRRPATVLVAGIALLAAPAAAATTVHQSFDMPAELPADAGARQGFEILSRHYPSGLLAPVSLVVAADGSLLTGDRLGAVDRLTDWLRATPGVAEVRSVTQPAGEPLTVQSLGRFTGGRADFAALGIDPDRVDITPLVKAMSSERGMRFDAATLARYPSLRERLAYFLGDGGQTTRIVVALDASPYARAALDLVRDLDDRAAAYLAGTELAGAQVAAAGPSAYFADIEDLADRDVRTVGAIVVAAILLILAVLLRSVVAPLYLMATVLLSLLAAMGITAWVFQNLLGHAGLAFWLTPFLFVMLVALGADYNIFITGRIREELDTGRTVQDATRAALVSTGPTITSAGLVLAGTFGALLITPIPSVQQIGFGVCVGILVDTFIVRSLIVPAATILLGQYAFWPSTGPAASSGRRRAAIAFSTAGVAGLAGTLVAVGLTAGGGASVPRVAAAASGTAQGTAASGTAQGTAASGTAQGTAASGTAQGTAPTAAAPSPSAAAVAQLPVPVRPTHAPGPPASAAPSKPRAATKGGTQPRRTPPRSPPPVIPATEATHTAPARPVNEITAPAEGSYAYQATGTRRIGLAGSEQPVREDATATVTRTSGADRAREFRVLVESASGTTDERRRYTPDAVELVALEVTSSGLSYGGVSQPAQELVRSPVRIGDRWTSRWRTKDTRGVTTATVTGSRVVEVGGRSQRCFEVARESTLTGSVQGTQRQRTCWSPVLGMPVHDEQRFEGTYAAVHVVMDVRLVLQQVPEPADPPDTGGPGPNAGASGGPASPALEPPQTQWARHAAGGP